MRLYEYREKTYWLLTYMLGEEAWIYMGNVDVYGKTIGRNQKRKRRRKGRRCMRILMHLHKVMYMCHHMHKWQNKNGEKNGKMKIFLEELHHAKLSTY